MKKTLFLLLAMIFAMQTWGQSTYIVANGTATNSYLPVYGNWMDANQHDQFIYPASEVAPLTGATISKMTFHAATTINSTWGTATCVISIGTPTESNYATATYNPTPLTQVYSGAISVVNGIMEFTFSTPYLFNGGNMLIDIVTTTSGSYNNINFLGITAANGGMYQYGSNSPSLQQFIPKATVEYTGGSPVVLTSAASSINATSTTLNGAYYNMTTTTYGFQYMLDASTDWSSATTVSATTNPMVETVSSLAPNTTYRFRAFANDGTTNVYGAEKTFTTLALPAYLPYSCNFENPTENNEWDFINGTQANQWYIGDATLNPDVNNSIGGVNGLYISNDAGLTYAYSGASGASPSRVYAYRDIEVPVGTNELKLTIDWKANGYGYGDLLRVYWVPTDAIITAGSIPPGALDISNALGTFYNNTNNNIQLNLATTWQTNEFVINTTQFPTLAGNTWRLMFHWRNENTSGVAQPPATVDNISLIAVTCATPTLLTASNATINSVDLAWTENGTATTWNVEYKKSTETTWQTVVATTNPYTVTGLDASSIYNFRVQASCGTEVSLFTNAISQATACASITSLPWTEGFEGITANNELPPCWASTSLGSYTFTQIADYGSFNRNARTGTKAAYFRYGCNDRFYTVGIQLTAGVSYDFSFWYVTDAYTGWNTLQAAVYSAQTTDSLIQVLQTVSGPMNTSYQKMLGAFTPTVDGIYYFGVYCQSNSVPYYLTLDDFKVQQSPTCLGPINASAINITPTTADVVFSAGDPTTFNYRIFWKEASASTWNQYDIMGDTTYQLTTLTPNTIYNVRIAAECSDLTYSETTEFNFRTACSDILTLPYTESFDSYGSGSNTNYPSCWTRLSDYGTYPYIYQWTNYSAPGSLYFYCYNNTFALGAMNAMDATINMNQLKINFKMYAWNSSAVLKVGVMTDPSNKNTFVQVGPNLTVNSTSTWEDKEVILSSYAGLGKNIAFLVEAPAGNGYEVYIDNVVVDVLPPCPNVYSFSTEVVSTTSFSANWDSSTDDGSGYVLSYSVNPTTLPFDPETATQVVIPTGTTLPYVISSLTPGDTIWVAVKAGCGSPWTTPQNLILPTVISPVPYTCNFEDTVQNATWTLFNGTQTNKWYIDTLGGNGGSGNGLYISSDNGLTVSYINSITTYVMASTYIQFNNANEFAFSFDWSAVGESCCDYVIAYLVPVGYNIVPGTPIPDSYRISPNLNSNSSWQTYTSVLGSTYSNTVKKLVFLWYNDTSLGSNPARVDNVSIQPLTCASPNGLVYSNVTAYSADLTWNNFPIGAEFVVEYKEAAASVWNQTSTMDSTKQLTLLTPSTTYNARIKAVCTPGDTSFASNMVTFTTSCVALVPPTVAEPFATMLPSVCWSSKSGILPATGNAVLSNNSGWYIRTSLGQNTAAVNMYSTSCQYWLITPSVDLGTGTTYQLDFDLAITDYYNSGVSNMALSPNARFVVLISTDNGNTWNSTGILKDWNNSTGTPFSTLNNTLQSQTIPLYDSVAMAPYSGIVKFAFFAYENDGTYIYDNDIHIDNFRINTFNPCVTPTSFHSTSVTDNSVTLDWTETGSATTWNVEYGPTGFTQGTGTVLAASAHPFIVPTLTDATTYDFYVQANCGGGSTSNWSPKITVGTAQIPAIVPVTFDFETASGFQFANNATGNNWYIGTATNNTTGGQNSMYISNDNGVTNAFTNTTNAVVWAYRDIMFTASTVDYVFSFDWKALAESCCDYINVYIGDVTTPVPSSSNTTINTPAGATTIATNLNSQTTWQTLTYTLPFASFSGQVKRVFFCWKNDNSIGDNPPAAIDNISITISSPVCAVPTNLAVSGITSSTANATWTAGGAETQWEVAYKTTAASTWNTAITSAPNYAFPSLTSSTAYDVKVRAICGAGDTSAYTAIVNFTTLATSCPAPTNLTASAITTTGATITWTAGGTETAWELEYKMASASTWTTVNVTTTPSHNLTTLTPSTAYNVRVRATCGTGIYSDYTVVVNFTTATPPCLIPTNVLVPAATITDQSALVTWTAAAGQTQWQVEYKLVSSANWTTMPVSTSTTETLTPLQSNSTYEVRIKALCSATNESPFTTPIQFTTAGAVTYVITATASGPGTITPSGSVVVAAGANQTFTFTPTGNADIDVLLVDNVNTTYTNNEYTFNNILANHTISVSFTDAIDENSLAKLVELYPNPTNATIEIRLNETQLQVKECRVYDIYGKLMSIVPVNADNTKIDVTDFAAGVYFIRMNSEMGVINKKFVKK